MTRNRCLLLLILIAFAAPAFGALSADSVLKAYLARRSGDYSQAAEHFRAALKADPQSVELRVRLVRVLSVFGEPDQSLAILDEGLKFNPGNKDLLYEKGKALVLAGRNAEAADVAVQALKDGGPDRSWAFALRLLDSLGRTDEAIGLADRWLASKPEQPADAFLERGILHYRKGDLDRAAADFGKVLEERPDSQQALEAFAGLMAQRGDAGQALKFYDRLLKLNPHNLSARLAIAQFLLEEKREEEALVALDEAQKWVGSDPLQRVRLGLLYLQANAPQKSLPNFEEVPESRRDDRAWFFLGLNYLELSRFDEALKALEKVGRDSAFYTEAASRRAAALKALGRGDEAVKLFAELYKGAPDDPEVVLAYSSMLQNLERHKEARELMLDFAAKHPDLRDPALLFNMGVVEDKLGDWEKSADYMAKVLEIAPEDAHALNYLGYTWADHGVHLEEALALLLRAVKLLPQNGPIADSLGWVYFKLGRFAEAVAELERAVSLSEKDAVIWEHLGDARLKVGDKEGALKAYDRSLELAPDQKPVRQKRDELK